MHLKNSFKLKVLSFKLKSNELYEPYKIDKLIKHFTLYDLRFTIF
jgi:hypothetical protein